MKITIDNTPQPIEIEKPDWQSIEKAISMLNSSTISFCILESENGDYLQCAGDKDRLTIEIREYNGDYFKHFRFGKTRHKRLIHPRWTSIDCKVGPIKVYDYEVLDSNDANLIFFDFFNKNGLFKPYNKREITKNFI